MNEKDVEKKKYELKSLMNDKLTPLLSSLQNSASDLNGLIEEVHLHKQTLIDQKNQNSQNLVLSNAFSKDIGSLPLVNKFSKDDCKEFAQDCMDIANIAFNGTMMAMKISMTSTDILTDIIKCPSWNLFGTYRCYTKNIQTARELIRDISLNGLPLLQKATSIAKNLLLDIKKCYSNNQQLKLQIQTKLNTVNHNKFSSDKFSKFLTISLPKINP